MVSIAVIGAGRIGRIHAANIAANPAARLAGVADVDAAAAEALAEACGARALTLEEAFAADAVLIASPTPTHADYIERAAAAGRADLLREADRSGGGSRARVPGARCSAPAWR